MFIPDCGHSAQALPNHTIVQFIDVLEPCHPALQIRFERLVCHCGSAVDMRHFAQSRS
jgi:hypothetical protein